MTKVSSQCFRLVKKYEGLSLTPYICPAGVPSIGYGCTYKEQGQPVTRKDPAISQERAESLLKRHLELFWFKVDTLVRPELNLNQMSALTSLAYNIGIAAFSTSTLLRKVNDDHEDPTIADEFRRWNKARVAGRLVVLPGLVKRRQEELTLYYLPVANVILA
jgi:lysozyme